MKIYDKWTRVRQAANGRGDANERSGLGTDSAETPALSPSELQQLHAKFDAVMPQIGSSGGGYGNAHSFLEGLLPPDAELAPNAGAGYRSAASRRQGDAASTMPNGSSNGLLTSAATPYLPELSSPDRQCFVEGTPVLLADGSKKPIEAVKIGDRIVGADGREGHVVEHWCEGIPDELIEIRTWGGRDAVFTCTTNHKWPAWIWQRECLCGCGSPVSNGKVYVNHHHPRKGGPELEIVGGTKRNWQRIVAGSNPIQQISAVDLRRGDCLLLPREFQEEPTETMPTRARLLGYYAAEGCVSGSSQIKFALHEKEISTLALDIQNCCNAENVETRMQREPAGKGMFVLTRGTLRYGDTRGQNLKDWLVANAGQGSSTKQLSPAVMAWPLALKLEFLRGYIAGDGSQSWKWCQKDGWGFRAGFVSTSEILGRQVARLLIQCGFPGQLRWKPAYTGSDGSPRQGAWYFEIAGNRARELSDIVWGQQSQSAAHEVRCEHAGIRMDKKFVYVPIRKVVHVKNTEQRKVFNLAVSRPDHLYCLGTGLPVLTANSYPIHRVLANRYWRMFYKLDPVIGTCVDLMSELPWGNFELSGEGVEGEVRDMMEHMSEVCQIRTLLPFFTREFFVVGEAVPHSFFDDDKGIWTYVTLHNPDQIEVVHAPFMNMEPYLEFVPDDKLRQVLTQDNAIVRHLRDSMPPDLLARLLARENIALSPVNCTFLPRKQHFYDTRGTSIVARMWRTLMYEDALYSASLATARRMACFVAGTSVITADGVKNIEDIQIGERVIAGNGTVQTVENAWCAGQSADGLTEINAIGTQPLLCTPNHRFLAWVAPRNCACGCGTPITATYDKTGKAKRRSFINGHHLRVLRNKTTGQMTAGASITWQEVSSEPRLRVPAGYEPLQKIEAQDLRVGDYLVIPRTFDKVDTKVAPEAARLLGYFAAEGSEKNTQNCEDSPLYEGVAFSLSLAEASTWAEDIKNCAAAVGVNASVYKYEAKSHTKQAQSGREGGTTVTIRCKKDVDFVRWIKRHAKVGANNHALSEEVMRWPLALKRELLIGYFRGDGHFGFPDSESTRCPQVTAASTSQTLIYQLRLIMAQLGLFGSISYNPKGDRPDEENWNDCWIISCTGRDARALAEIIWGIKIDAPTREGKGAKSGGAARTWCDDQYVYVPIQSVEHRDDELPVYNLSVSGDASYLAEIVHTFNSPLKVAKLGNPTTNWIPGPEHERRLLELIAQAENDPGAWLCYHYAVQFELVGVQERVMKIDASAELIERNKLIALGVSKSFLHGEVSYASSKTGLTIFLRRLKAIRDMFESSWLYPKFFRQAAEINKWIKPTPAELSHRVRVRRSHKELLEDHRYIVPRIEWDHSLNPAVDAEMINAMQGLSQLGIKFSKTTMMAAVGRNFEEELNMLVKDSEAEQRILKDHPELLQPQGGGGDIGGLGGLGGGAPPSVLPPVPPDTFSGFSDAPGGAPPPPDAGPGSADMTPPGDALAPEPAHAAAAGDTDDAGSAGSLSAAAPMRLMKDFLAVVSGYQPDEELWERALQSPAVSAAIDSGDVPTAWEVTQQWLAEQDYPAQEIVAMGELLQKKARIKVNATADESEDPTLLVGAGFLPRRS